MIHAPEHSANRQTQATRQTTASVSTSAHVDSNTEGRVLAKKGNTAAAGSHTLRGFCFHHLPEGRGIVSQSSCCPSSSSPYPPSSSLDNSVGCLRLLASKAKIEYVEVSQPKWDPCVRPPTNYVQLLSALSLAPDLARLEELMQPELLEK